MKKTLAMVLAMGMTIASLTACGGSKPAETTAAATEAQTEAASSATDTKAEVTEPAGGKAEGPITVVSREDGSGTRGAFIELFGIESKNDAGEKVDNTTEDAEITNSTSVMMTTIAGNKGAIGYVSLGSLNDTVKAVAIDGADATVWPFCFQSNGAMALTSRPVRRSRVCPCQMLCVVASTVRHWVSVRWKSSSMAGMQGASTIQTASSKWW